MASPPPLPFPAPPAIVSQTLRRLYLTLFLRGRTSRGLKKGTAPKSVGSKLAGTLVLYALMGLLALVFMRQGVFALSVYLHGMTFVFLGMFVAASAGEALFNKEEADILMHRPITPRALLWAKISMLVQISLWLAGAFNLVGLFVGAVASDGNWLFPLVHIVSTVLETLFCISCVVITYQLCLRWFGRERLDSLMTMAQVFVAVGAVLGGQLVPHLIGRFGRKLSIGMDAWWIAFLPPAWFAGFDDAIAGSGATGSWVLAGVGFLATSTVLWLAFGKLAHEYESGLKVLNETTARHRQSSPRRFLVRLTHLPPLNWCLRDSVTRASFLLSAAYLFRDRDMKLRVYPGIAPMLVMPLIFLLQDQSPSGSGGFGLAFTGAFLGMIPLIALDLLQYSQNWQASDLFRAAPLKGPAPICCGARHAVLWLFTLPVLLVVVLIGLTMGSDLNRLSMLLPGLIAIPIYALVPHLGGKAVPFSLPTEGAKSATRVVVMFVVMGASMGVAALGMFAWSQGGFIELLLCESALVLFIYMRMRRSISKADWKYVD